jgi:hypothetical protein
MGGGVAKSGDENLFAERWSNHADQQSKKQIAHPGILRDNAAQLLNGHAGTAFHFRRRIGVIHAARAGEDKGVMPGMRVPGLQPAISQV